MTKRPQTIGSLVVIGLLLAACSGTSSTPSPIVAPTVAESPSASESAAASPSAMASESPSASPEASPSASPSAAAPSGSPMAAADLASSIPTKVDGKPLTVKTATAAELPMFTGDAGKAALATLFARLKTTPDQASAAIGTASDKSLTIVGLSVGGVDTVALQAALVSIFSATSKGVSINLVQVGSKTATEIVNSDTPKVTVYAYAKDAAVYIVQANSAKLGQDAVAALP